jgi:ATP-binding cassette subfamily F protein uup
LSESLSEWGEETGAIVVISHDKAFCEKVGFTHVATIQVGGTLVVEQRGARESDWDSSINTLQRSSSSTQTAETKEEEEPPSQLLDKALRKQAFNAPKRIAKIETLVGKKEETIAALDEEMWANGHDMGKLVDLTKEKEKLEEQVMELMEEWEELETLLAQVA